MKFLVDNALSPTVSRHLRDAGYDSIHVRDIEMQTASDDVMFARASPQVGLAQRNPTQSRQLCHSSSTCDVGLRPRANPTYAAGGVTYRLQKPANDNNVTVGSGSIVYLRVRAFHKILGANVGFFEQMLARRRLGRREAATFA